MKRFLYYIVKRLNIYYIYILYKINIILAEGSWIQGGSRTTSGAGIGTTGSGSGNSGVQAPPLNITGPVGGHTDLSGGSRQNLVQSPNMGMAQAGPPHNSSNSQNALSSNSHQVGPNLHHYRGLIPPFVSFAYTFYLYYLYFR